MPDSDGNAPAAPAAPTASPPAGEPPIAPPPAGGAGAPVVDDLDQPMTLREARELRRENAGYREKVRVAEEAERTRQQADMTELQKAQAKLAEVEREREVERQALQVERLRVRVESEASKLGFANPEDAFRLLDQASVKLDKSGQPENIEALLRELLQTRPYLLGRPGNGSADAGAGRGAGGTGGENMNDLIRGARGTRVNR